MFTDIGMDLGTAKTVIFAGRGVVLNEPSVVSVETETGRPIKFGHDAYRMVGRTPDRITTIFPIERGVIANYEVAEQMVRYFLKKIYGNRMLKPRVMVSMPSGVTAVQQRSVRTVVEDAGARDVCLIEAPVAAAIGVGVDFKKPHGTIVVDIGAGRTDVAVLSMGGLAQCESIRLASLDFNEAIIRYVRKEYNILIGVRTAEELKQNIGCVVHRPVEVAMKSKGRNLFSGLPEVFEITSNEICDAISEVSYGICGAIQSVLERTPPELVADISTDGILLTGGGALIHGMPELLQRYTGIAASIVAEPATCVARGTGKALEHPELLENGDYEFRSLQDLTLE